MGRTTKKEIRKVQTETTEKKLIEEGIIHENKPEEHSSTAPLKLIRRTVWEDLTVALNNFFSFHEESIPYTVGNWTIKCISGKSTATDFIVLYDGVRCFPVNLTGRNAYTINDRLDCDMKNYMSIGKRVTNELLHRGYVVTNASVFQRGL